MMQQDMQMAEPETEKLEKLKSALLAIISHELRTPLTDIMLFVSVLREGFVGETNDEQRRYYDRIAHSAAHLTSLINDLMTYAQVEAEVVELRRELTDLGQAAQAALDLHLSEMEAKRIQIVEKFVPGLVPVPVDRQKIIRVFSNLIGNAVNFTAPGGRVMLRTRTEEGFQILDVADTGIGIPKEKQDGIFKSFYQVEDPLIRRTGGFGIGLAYASRIVEAHNGKITFDSVEGKGSLFSVWLPVSGEQPENTRP